MRMKGLKLLSSAVAVAALSATLISASALVPTTALPVASAEATTNTGGYSSATGSSDTAVTVTSLAELENAFYSGEHHIIISGNIYGGSSLTTLTFASTDWNNTTIEGAAGTNPALVNIQLKFDGEMLPAGTNIENIVVKNITFHGNITDLQNLSGTAIQPGGAGTNYEGISFRRIDNAWVDHCTIYDTSDDLFSISRDSDNITVSYSHFYFTDAWLNMIPDPVWTWDSSTSKDLATERIAAVIGRNYSDSNEQTGKLHITLHHNRFGPNMKGRPLVRGFVHMYNNYFDNSTVPSGTITATDGYQYNQAQYNAIQIGSGGTIYAENNYFYKTNNSIAVGLDSSTDPWHYAVKLNSDGTSSNIFNSTTTSGYQPDEPTADLSWSTPWSSIYNVTPEDTSLVPNDVQAHVGPFK